MASQSYHTVQKLFRGREGYEPPSSFFAGSGNSPPPQAVKEVSEMSLRTHTQFNFSKFVEKRIAEAEARGDLMRLSALYKILAYIHRGESHP